mmetsp:Transcript_20945/g.69197  ORF Transcript_20945/g.69197 Transcript_20945/m.69197 type:complete len:215 (+) Transcript_20945:75-719(+)
MDCGSSLRGTTIHEVAQVVDQSTNCRSSTAPTRRPALSTASSSRSSDEPARQRSAKRLRACLATVSAQPEHSSVALRPAARSPPAPTSSSEAHRANMPCSREAGGAPAPAAHSSSSPTETRPMRANRVPCRATGTPRCSSFDGKRSAFPCGSRRTCPSASNSSPPPPYSSAALSATEKLSVYASTCSCSPLTPPSASYRATYRSASRSRAPSSG